MKKNTDQQNLDQCNEGVIPDGEVFNNLNTTTKNKKKFNEEETELYKQIIKRAELISNKENSIRKIKNGFYLVQSQNRRGWYRIKWSNKQLTCDCLDFEKNGKIRPCKHIIALKIRLNNGFVILDKKKQEPLKKTYSQNWPAYNLARRLEFEYFNRLLFNLLSTIKEPIRKGVGRPSLLLQDQLFCCMMKVYSKKNLRTAEYEYKAAYNRNQITHAPHCNAVSKTLCNPKITPILYNLVPLSAIPLSGIDTCFAIDSSGFRCSTFNHYCSHAHGGKRKHNWLKGHIASGTVSNVISSVRITDEHVADSTQFELLVTETAKYFPIEYVAADKAYSSRKNIAIVDKFGAKPFILFKNNATGRSKGALWKKNFHFYQYNKEKFMKYYHQRSNVESTYHAIKMRLDENISSKNRVAQENELLCKIVCYNLLVLIQPIIEFGLKPDFFRYNYNIDDFNISRGGG